MGIIPTSDILAQGSEITYTKDKYAPHTITESCFNFISQVMNNSLALYIVR